MQLVVEEEGGGGGGGGGRRRRRIIIRKESLKLYSSFYYRKFVLYVLVAILIETENSKYFLPHMKKFWFVCTDNFSFFN